MSSRDGLDKRIAKALTLITNHTHPVQRELPKRIFDERGRIVYETSKERAYPGAIYKEYVGDPDDGCDARATDPLSTYARVAAGRHRASHSM